MDLRLIASVVFLCSSCAARCLIVRPNDPFWIEDSEKTKFINLYVQRRGYELEEHNVLTEDGYNLTYHRVLQGWVPKNNVSRKAILLQHGLATSSAAFLIPDRQALAFVLSDAGYDVWLGNSRGNKYSRKDRKRKTIPEKGFWQFSLHEMAVYDLSAGIDYILQETQQPRLFVVGHSHGATLALMLAASRPQYQEKMTALMALAPVVYLKSLASSAGNNALARLLVDIAVHTATNKEMNNDYSMFLSYSEIIELYCKTKLCPAIQLNLQGSIEKYALSDITRFEPAGTSTKSILHFKQQIQNVAEFKQYNYGEQGNLDRYNSSLPPTYDLSSVKIPVHIFYSTNDMFVNLEDTTMLMKQLPNSVLHSVNAPKFNHLDFLWGHHANSLVYVDIIGQLPKYFGSEHDSKYDGEGIIKTVVDEPESMVHTHDGERMIKPVVEESESMGHTNDGQGMNKPVVEESDSRADTHDGEEIIKPIVEEPDTMADTSDGEGINKHIVEEPDSMADTDYGEEIINPIAEEPDSTADTHDGEGINKHIVEEPDCMADTDDGEEIIKPIAEERDSTADTHDGEVNYKPIVEESGSMADIHDGEGIIKHIGEEPDKHDGEGTIKPIVEEPDSMPDIHDRDGIIKSVVDKPDSMADTHDGEEINKSIVEEPDNMAGTHDGVGNNKPADEKPDTHDEEGIIKPIDEETNSMGHTHIGEGIIKPIFEETNNTGHTLNGEEINKPIFGETSSTGNTHDGERTIELVYEKGAYHQAVQKLLEFSSYIQSVFKENLKLTKGNDILITVILRLKKKVDYVKDICVKECKELSYLLDQILKYNVMISNVEYGDLRGTVNLYPTEYESETAMGKLINHYMFIQNMFNIDLSFFQGKKIPRGILEELLNKIDLDEDSCQGECKEVRWILDILIRSIESKAEVSRFKQVSSLNKKDFTETNKCIGSCKDNDLHYLRRFLHHIRTSYLNPSIGGESQDLLIQEIREFERHEYIDELKEYRDYILATYHIDIKQTESEEISLSNVLKLKEKIDSDNENCLLVCKTILRPLKYVVEINTLEARKEFETIITSKEDYSKMLQKLWGYRKYIESTFGISIGNSQPEDITPSIRQQLQEAVDSKKENCDNICSDIRLLLSLIGSHRNIEKATITGGNTVDQNYIQKLTKQLRDLVMFIRTEYDMDLGVFGTENIPFSIVRELKEIVSKTGNCTGKCKEVSLLLDNMLNYYDSTNNQNSNTTFTVIGTDVITYYKYYEAIYKLITLLPFIQSTYNIHLHLSQSGVFDESSIKQLEEKVSEGHVCEEKCEEIRSLLDVINTNEFQNGFKGDEKSFTVITAFKYHELLVSLTRLSDFIKSSYNINVQLNQWGNIPPGILQILEDKVNKDKEDCKGQCEEVRFLLRQIRAVETQKHSTHNEVGTYIIALYKYREIMEELMHYASYIKETLQISLVYENDEVPYNIIQNIEEQLYGISIGSCGDKCHEVRYLIWLIHSFLQKVKPMVPTSNFKSSKGSKNEIDSIFKPLRRYQKHIQSTYGVSLHGSDEEKLAKIETLSNKIENSPNTCDGKCKEVRGLLRNFRRFKTNLNKTYN